MQKTAKAIQKTTLPAWILLVLLTVGPACQHQLPQKETPSEVPDEIILEEEVEFVDQSVDDATTVYPPAPHQGPPPPPAPPPPPPPPPAPKVNEIFRVVTPPPQREQYAHLPENDFQAVTDEPLSTFSIDVDRASYSIVRRYLEGGQLPPPGAVRTEELINYFTYDYPQPAGAVPFSMTATIGACPWQPDHRLLRVGLQGRNVDIRDVPPSNLVFLIDVSGSMNHSNKLPLLKKAFQLLVQQMRPQDRVAIVTYAGAAGLVLPSTSAKDKQQILQAIDGLRSGGSTAGAAGIQLAYQIAQEQHREGRNSRVVLATDGDFNVGANSEAALVELIERHRNEGVFLSVLGFGQGNYQDAKMEQLADHGNGNYAYIDQLQEARKVLVSEFGGTLMTIAKDVKLQLEFNPTQVAAYRLIGYENRLLNQADFNDDKKDAGELGAGHTVTALYELVPTGLPIPAADVDSLRYQVQHPRPATRYANEWLTVKLRYKAPDSNESQLLSWKIEEEGISWKKMDADFRFAVAVAGFGQLLRRSEYTAGLSLEDVAKWTKKARGADEEGYRAGFVQLVELAGLLEGKDNR